jgi:hypothetical protein
MSDVAIISAVSPMVSGVIVGLLFWGWKKFVNRLDENRDVTLAAVAKVEAKQSEMNRQFAEHTIEDAAIFKAQGERIAKNEGALEVLSQIAAAQAAKEQKPT